MFAIMAGEEKKKKKRVREKEREKRKGERKRVCMLGRQREGHRGTARDRERGREKESIIYLFLKRPVRICSKAMRLLKVAWICVRTLIDNACVSQ